MFLSQFNFDLPDELIAQYPRSQRDESRLMVINRKTEEIFEIAFKDLLSFLDPEDSLIFNDTKVFPARLLGKRKAGGRLELLLTKERGHNCWEVLAKPGKKLKLGTELFFSDRLTGRVIEDLESYKVVQFDCKNLMDELDRIGIIPLPPYIKRETPDPKDKESYQTVYAQSRGSVAAPTAGLHFTPKLLKELAEKGIQQEMLTLHVGLGTFQSIVDEDLNKHLMHEEVFHVSQEVASNLNQKTLGRSICVGTTTLRALESAANSEGFIETGRNKTSLFIQPGYRFKYVDHLLTNFHLPKSSLFILICAFMGESLAKKAYQTAIEKQFKFFSYGDAMLIL
ncbi:MAG: S-adenosylmethionine:tRNA ribosyltransferase-isomerase [Chlamydiae bacterium]|nr:S-adenosylmethionine:tRNA ribosyltransferase-isomerase [Chlamydiota bacterium]